LTITERIRNNFYDLVSFGPQFFFRHLARVSGTTFAVVNIPGYGKLNVRPGESDVAALRQVFREKQYQIPSSMVSTRIQNRYHEILQANNIPVIVDAGANIGSASLWFLRQFPKAAVVAIEPEPGNVSMLKKNAENWSRVTILEAAIGSNAGFVSVQNEATGWGARTERANKGIPIVTMQEAFDCVPNGSPFIAKIDIEGFESDLFSQNTGWIDDVYLLYIEPHDWMLPGKMTSRSFQQAMAQHTFELFIIGENLVYVRV
jgi:FkbM family methyltransferase